MYITVYSMYTAYIVQFTVSSVHCTLYTIHYTLCNVQCTLYTMGYANLIYMNTVLIIYYPGTQDAECWCKCKSTNVNIVPIYIYIYM